MVCQLAMTGTCFGCPNCLITKDHLPAVLAIADIADPDRAANVNLSREYWKPIHEIITTIVLPEFPDEDIAEARKNMGAVPLALGIRNDLRGPDDD